MTQVTPKAGNVVLIRHTQVDRAYVGRCYGASDVGLSDTGHSQIAPLAMELAAYQPVRVYHSGLQRTRLLAEDIADRAKCKLLEDPRLREMNFGECEGKTWDEIYEIGVDIADLIHKPDVFSLPGGETTFAVRDRMQAWYSQLPTDGLNFAVSHGGAIASLLGSLSQKPVEKWPALIPEIGTYVSINT